jgi:hypothetical protein
MKLPELSPSLVRAALGLLAIGAVPLSGAIFGLEVALLVAAFAALGLVIAFVWASVQNLTGDSPLTLEEALTLGQPSVEEEQKRAVLRALKDLEYERSVGKISDHDYAELSARYREEAKRLMQAVDASLTPARERAEKLLAERVARNEKRIEAKLEEAKIAAENEFADASDDAGPPPSSSAAVDASEKEERS